MPKYAVTTNEELRKLCIKHRWFYHGTNDQYEKMFQANEEGVSVEEIATIIWLCSDHNKDFILYILKQTHIEYLKSISSDMPCSE